MVGFNEYGFGSDDMILGIQTTKTNKESFQMTIYLSIFIVMIMMV